ncbi:MAG TPA: cupin domain-containing protein [Egibacteraceae bacterium]|jgi:homogentisate 1,2-dioxygenase|nr:cupin domain-containing protein [Egibacteraceae bacterium]
MPYYRRVGEVPRKRHTQFRRPDGGLYAEELVGAEGFSSDAALLYHQRIPTAIVAAEALSAEPDRLTPNHPLKPRHLRTHALKTGGDAVGGRQLLLANDDVRISYAAVDTASPLYRNAVGDELVYVESGTLTLESVYGSLPAGAGDYVIVPASVTHRWVPNAAGGAPARLLVVEATGHVTTPDRYLSKRGQFLEHAPYHERDLRAPGEPLIVEDGETDVVVRHRVGLTRFTYAAHPFDVVGWDGCLYPYAFNIADFEPITGRIHQPPPVHQTFAGPRFVVCSFVPRMFDYHPQAVPAPYNHANVDSDEVLFYVGGNFMSRVGAGIELGSATLHPAGLTHGPQPGSVEASIGKEATDETAVMIDTFRPLHLGPAARSCEDEGYAWSWARGLAAGEAAPPESIA